MKDSGEKEWLKKLLNNELANPKTVRDVPKDSDGSSLAPAVKKEGRMVKLEILKGGGFADVAGMENLKAMVTEDFVNAIKYPKQASRYNVKPTNMLFYGPPGCGKTYFAKKIAEELGVSFISVAPDELGSTFIHGSQQKIRAMFDEAVKNAPTIIFLDEIDALVPDRNLDESNHQANETNEFLVMLNDSISKGVYVIGATNNMQRIEGAALRPGRFDERVYIGLPDVQSRKSMFKYYLGKLPIAEDIDYESLAVQTDGFSCSDIDYAVRKASKVMFNKSIKEMNDDDAHVNLISQKVVEDVIANLQPSVSAKELIKYENMRDQYGFGKTQTVRRKVGFNIN